MSPFCETTFYCNNSQDKELQEYSQNELIKMVRDLKETIKNMETRFQEELRKKDKEIAELKKENEELKLALQVLQNK